MDILQLSDPQLIDKAVHILNSGGLIVYPTETCYGMGADATHQKAVDTLLAFKSRREGKPVSIAVSDTQMAHKYAEINKTARNLYDNFLPGPLTVVSRSKHTLAQGIESEYGTIGIRIPDYPLVRNIVTKLGHPITATSANISYKPRPYSIKSFLHNLPQKHLTFVDLIIDAGELPKNEVSTIVDTTLNTTNVIRDGKVAFATTGKQVMEAHTNSEEETIDFGSMVMLRYMNELRTRPIVFALGGELGTGKTRFAKGVARQLGIKAVIKSPTYTISHEYPYSRAGTAGTCIHIDTWRLSEKGEFETLHLENAMKAGNVIIIEWANKFLDILPESKTVSQPLVFTVSFAYTSESSRNITVELAGRD